MILPKFKNTGRKYAKFWICPTFLGRFLIKNTKIRPILTLFESPLYPRFKYGVPYRACTSFSNMKEMGPIWGGSKYTPKVQVSPPWRVPRPERTVFQKNFFFFKKIARRLGRFWTFGSDPCFKSGGKNVAKKTRGGGAMTHFFGSEKKHTRENRTKNGFGLFGKGRKSTKNRFSPHGSHFFAPKTCRKCPLGHFQTVMSRAKNKSGNVPSLSGFRVFRTFGQFFNIFQLFDKNKPPWPTSHRVFIEIYRKHVKNPPKTLTDSQKPCFFDFYKIRKANLCVFEC